MQRTAWPFRRMARSWRREPPSNRTPVKTLLWWRDTDTGVLDPSFDSDGMVTTDFLGSASDLVNEVALATQPDGMILAVGSSNAGRNADFALARFSSDGNLDTSFGTDGQVTTDFGSLEDDTAHGVAVQGDGKIVVVGVARGSSSKDFGIARYNADGSLDNTFGSNGLVTTDLGSNREDGANAVAIQPDGRIVVGGYTKPSSGQDFAVARYLSDGNLDSSFGSGGMVTIDFGSSAETAYGLVLQDDGKIVLAGYSYQGNTTGYDFTLARLDSDGGLDTTLDGDGKVTTDFGAYDVARTVTTDASGRIVVAGRAYLSGDKFALRVITATAAWIRASIRTAR